MACGKKRILHKLFFNKLNSMIGVSKKMSITLQKLSVEKKVYIFTVKKLNFMSYSSMKKVDAIATIKKEEEKIVFQFQYFYEARRAHTRGRSYELRKENNNPDHRKQFV
jgi:hypothetical protein